MKKLKSLKLMLLGLVAFASSNAFAADADITAKVTVTGTAGKIYAPVVDGKALLQYRITKVMDNNGNGDFKSGEVEVYENAAEMKNVTSITIGATVTIPITITGKGESTRAFKIVKIDNNGSQAFTPGNSNKLQSVTIGSNVTTIADNAFNGIKTLTTLTFGGAETSIGDNAFRGTILTGTDDELALPSKLETIGDYAFSVAASKYPVFSKLSIPATVTSIGVSAFEGCENLSEVTLAASSQLITLKESAFAYTSLTSLDLSNATANKNGTNNNTADDGMRSFGTDDASYGPFTSALHPKTSLITSVKLPSTCVTIYDAAFKDLQYLKTIDLSKVKTIEANAFEGCAALEEVAVGTGAGNNDITIGANAFSGCTKLATVELGQIRAATIDNAAFAADGVTYAAAGIKTLKFNAISAAMTTKPFVGILTIEEVHFLKYLTNNATIPTGSFDVNAAGAKLTKIYYNANSVTVPTTAANVKQPFAIDAFGNDASDANRVATLYTKLAQYTHANGFNTDAKLLNGIIIEAGYTSTFTIGSGAEGSKKMLKDKNSNGYYYYFNNNTGGFVSIDKVNGANEADVTVYQTYTDVVNNELNIYFMPLAVKNGAYTIANAQVVIIKSSKEDAVEAVPDGAASTMMENGGAILNELKITNATYSKLGVMSDANLLANGTKEIRFFNHPTNSGFGFTKYDSANQSGMNANTVYLQTDPVASGRVNMVWLDNMGNMTAIETIETKANTQNNDAIYNIAGQKVGAGYKGLVIKNGKKYILK